MMADDRAACQSQVEEVEEVEGHSCSKENPKPYSEKTDLTSGVLVVSGSSLYIGKELLSIYSPMFKEMFANAEVGELYELPVVKIDDESVDDFIGLLDLIYPDTGKSCDDFNLYNTVRLSHKYKIRSLRQKCIKFVRKQPVPKLMYRQLADTYELEELKDLLTYNHLAQKVPTANIDSELKAGLEPQIATNVYRLSHEYQIKDLRQKCIKYIQSKEPKLIYRQLADKYDLEELRDRLKDQQLVQKVPTPGDRG